MLAPGAMGMDQLSNLAINTIRTLSIDAVQKANAGHPGLPMGAAPMAYVLWQKHLSHNPRNPKWPDRDRFVLSAGHGSMLLYSLLYAALGSLVSRQEDVQSATSPLMMIIMVGYFAAALGPDIVGEQGMAIMSQVPFFSPYVMLRRVAEGTVAPWEFGLAVVLLLVSIGIALFAAARIYSAGVLLYGQRVGLRQIFKAARVSR